jgi:hypothetical protein
MTDSPSIPGAVPFATLTTPLGPLTSSVMLPVSCQVLQVTAIDPKVSSTPASAYLGKQCQTIHNNASQTDDTGLDPLDDNFSCWPQITKIRGPDATLIEQPSERGYYSPGISCPVGYAPACSAVGPAAGAQSQPDVPPNFQFQYALARGETAIGCCPLFQGYELDSSLLP